MVIAGCTLASAHLVKYLATTSMNFTPPFLGINGLTRLIPHYENGYSFDIDESSLGGCGGWLHILDISCTFLENSLILERIGP